MPAMGMVRRPVVPMPWPSGRSSWNWRSGRWQVAQATSPLALKRASKKSARPNSTARGLSATRFEGSNGVGGSASSERERTSASSASVQAGPCTKR